MKAWEGGGQSRTIRGEGAGPAVKERVSAVAVLGPSSRRKGQRREQARLGELVLRRAGEIGRKLELLQTLQGDGNGPRRAGVRVAAVRRVVDESPGPRRQRAVREHGERGREHHAVEKAVVAAIHVDQLSRGQADVLRHPAAGAGWRSHLHQRRRSGAARRRSVAPPRMGPRPVGHAVAVSVGIGERAQVPAVTAAAEVVGEPVGQRVVEAGGLLVENVMIAVAVPHFVRTGALQEVLAPVARDLAVALAPDEQVLAPVRGDVARRGRGPVPAGLDRAERELPADRQRRISRQGLVDEARLLLSGEGRAVVVDARVVDEGQLEAEPRADRVRRAERDRQGELAVVEVDRIEGVVVEDAVGVAGSRVRIVVGPGLRPEPAGHEHQQAGQDRPRKFSCHVRRSFSRELAGEALAILFVASGAAGSAR